MLRPKVQNDRVRWARFARCTGSAQLRGWNHARIELAIVQ